VYGTAFPSEAELGEHLKRLEEAKRRDHRTLGRELDLYSFDDLVGPGFALWHPKGAIVRQQLEDLIRSEVVRRGYQPVYSPHVAREQLLVTSGHLEHYKENLFGGMELEGQRYLVKPMNCPFHIAIYRSQMRSYRELPIRYAELGTVYRYERSGVLHGLLRVRGFTQDDAHLFVREEQIEDEMRGCVQFALDILDLFGFEDVRLFLSTRPESFMGEIALWDRAETSIRSVLEATGRAFEVDEGGGAFYGPKIDLKIRDALGREWQCGTFQLDLQLPQRFELEYVAQDGTRQRPVMIHRALFGSVERFIAVLIEHFAGAFPLWLAPVQARVLTVSEKVDAYAREVEARLRAEGIRVEADVSAEKLGAKIRKATLEKIPYMVVVGEKDMAARVVSPRTREGKQLPATPLDEFARQVGTDAKTPAVGGKKPKS
jgi:threonyl-tRNA synthetase